MRLSVLIPAYNERATILPILAMVCDALPEVEKEIIVVDDCSTDGTRTLLQNAFPGGSGRYSSVTARPNGTLALTAMADGPVSINVLYHEKNSGKGAGLRSALARATREVAKGLKVSRNAFGVDVKISAQIAKNRTLRIYELGISHYGRTYIEGKKINWPDGVKALLYLLKFRFR